jgi:cytochrome c biogenesis protein ResB
VVVTAQYSYGWSFFLAILGFLGAELSAALCLIAFLNRFDSEVKAFFVEQSSTKENTCQPPPHIRKTSAKINETAGIT